MVALQALSLGLLASQALAFPAASQQAATATLPTTASSSTAVASSQLDQLANFAYNVTTDSVAGGPESKRGGCTLQNLRVRRDWRAFSKTQKKDYINSVLCLQKLPSRTPAHLAPGARTRYDDFVATHINQTQIIHYTVCLQRGSLPEDDMRLTNDIGYLLGLASLLHLRIRAGAA